MTRSIAICVATVGFLIAGAASAQDVHRGTGYVTKKDPALGFLYINAERFFIAESALLTLNTGTVPIDLDRIPAATSNEFGGLGIATRAAYEYQVINGVKTLIAVDISNQND